MTHLVVYKQVATIELAAGQLASFNVTINPPVGVS